MMVLTFLGPPQGIL